MRLSELEPVFLQVIEDPASGKFMLRVETTLEGMDGLSFICPQCNYNQGKRIGNARVQVWKTGTHESHRPDARHDFSGTGLADITLSGTLTHGCGWQGTLASGEVANAPAV